MKSCLNLSTYFRNNHFQFTCFYFLVLRDFLNPSLFLTYSNILRRRADVVSLQVYFSLWTLNHFQLWLDKKIYVDFSNVSEKPQETELMLRLIPNRIIIFLVNYRLSLQISATRVKVV